MQKLIKITALLLCAAILAGLAGCAGLSQGGNPDTLSIVCTLFPQYDFVKALVGDKAQVTLLLTPGTDSHSYDPSPADIVKINECDLFIYTGDLLETWTSNVVGGLPQTVKVLNVSSHLELSAVENGHEHSGEHHDSHSADPHVWTSPANAKLIVEEIADAICGIDAENKAFYEENEKKYLAELDVLDNAIKSIVSAAKTNKIVMCDRFAMHYFCEHYGLDYIAAFDSCTSNTEPSPAVIVEIVKAVEKENISAVFAAELSNQKVALSVSEQTGAKVLELHSCHNVSAQDFEAGETYLSLMYKNAENLRIALS